MAYAETDQLRDAREAPRPWRIERPDLDGRVEEEARAPTEIERAEQLLDALVRRCTGQ